QVANASEDALGWEITTRSGRLVWRGVRRAECTTRAGPGDVGTGPRWHGLCGLVVWSAGAAPTPRWPRRPGEEDDDGATVQRPPRRRPAAGREAVGLRRGPRRAGAGAAARRGAGRLRGRQR